LTSPLFCKYNLTRSCFNMSKRGLAITGRASKNAAPKKNKLDLMKTKLYARIGIKIVMAAKKEGGTDPKANKELAQALHTAHVNNLPKENIERALRRASEKAPEDYKSGVYEVFGHGGVGIIVTTLSDNSNRANNLVKMTAKKADAKMAASGSVLFSFDYKGVVRVNFPYKEDDIIELALEAGVDELDFAEIPSDKGDESSANYKAIITGI
jgi:transcriptional/translational regulatory protein YebC/TACO1